MLQSRCKLVVNTRVLGKLVWSIFRFTIILNFKFTRHMTNNWIMQIQSTSSKQVPPWWDEVEAADICSALTRKEMPLGNGPFLYIPSRVMKSVYMGEEIRLIYTESKNYSTDEDRQWSENLSRCIRQPCLMDWRWMLQRHHFQKLSTGASTTDYYTSLPKLLKPEKHLYHKGT